MSEFKNKSITTKGLELLSKGLSGDKLEFTRIEMGGGKFTGDIGEAEALVDLKQNLPITKISRKGSQVTLSTALKIEDITADFDWTEIGVYAKGNDGVEILYLYGHTHNSSFVSKDSLNEKLINITLMVSNVAEVTALIDDSLVYLTAEALQTHEQNIHTHTDIREALEEVKNSLSTLDISWEGITGKPQQFPPTQHNHSWGEIPDRPTSLPASGGNADTVGGRSFIWQGQGGQPQWVWGANEPGNQCYVWNPSDFNVNSATYVQGRNLCSEVDGLKQSVVSGKQLVVNAINGKVGYNSGLTTDHSHNDYAWWITNQIKSVSASMQCTLYAERLHSEILHCGNNVTIYNQSESLRCVSNYLDCITDDGTIPNVNAGSRFVFYATKFSQPRIKTVINGISETHYIGGADPNGTPASLQQYFDIVVAARISSNSNGGYIIAPNRKGVGCNNYILGVILKIKDQYYGRLTSITGENGIAFISTYGDAQMNRWTLGV